MRLKTTDQRGNFLPTTVTASSSTFAKARVLGCEYIHISAQHLKMHWYLTMFFV